MVVNNEAPRIVFEYFWEGVYLEGAECEVDEVPNIASAPFQQFVNQHGEHHLVDAQQSKQDQRGAQQANGKQRR